MSTWFPAFSAKQWAGFIVAVVLVMVVVKLSPLRKWA